MSFLTDIAAIAKGFAEVRALRAEVAANEKRAVERQSAVLRSLKDVIEILQASADVDDERYGFISAKLDEILRIFKPGDAVVMELEVTDSETGETRTYKSGANMILPRNSTVTGTVKVYDSTDPATRNETTLDGTPNVVLTPGPNDPNLTMSVDGLSITFTSGPKAGVALLTVDGDAKIGDGVTPISFTADVNVPAGEAVVGEIVFSEPQPIQ